MSNSGEQGPHIQAFSSMEEVFNWMADNELQAIQNALPEQWAIGWGDRAFRIVDELAIYGEVFTPAEFLMLPEPIDEQALDEEARYELDSLRDSHDRGYRYGKWFSTVVPDGEYGSAHVASLWPITVEEFEEARSRDWLHPTLVFRIGQRVGHAYKKNRDEHDAEDG